MEALTSGSEVNKREFFYANKNSESNEKETKEKVVMFMMEKLEKKSRVRFGIHKKRKGNLKKKHSMTSLPYYLTNTY